MKTTLALLMMTTAANAADADFYYRDCPLRLIENSNAYQRVDVTLKECQFFYVREDENDKRREREEEEEEEEEEPEEPEEPAEPEKPVEKPVH